jgi:hypothetical protein
MQEQSAEMLHIAGLLEGFEDVEQIARGSRQAIHAGDDEQVAGLKPLDHLTKLSAVATRAGGNLGVDRGAADGPKLAQLSGEALLAGAHTRVTDDHPSFMQRNICDRSIERAMDESLGKLVILWAKRYYLYMTVW